ncbi:hypothetical protein [Roseivirga sp. UBA1976]|uniref:hypothetical protein n=1 Tax=Roseivirga sp. UBA1976 TaxID=1947386 RepID=UPI00257AAE12|nr:hypothetical protein [Roseivirga sp. UBA1976]|tara:strand:+ start:7421 stop:7762 length:342 start_codon:yes stop_codon:yes gene_type:complete
MAKSKYTVTSGQKLMDVALEVYGDITGIFKLLEDNPELITVQDDLEGGQVLRIDSDKVVNKEIASYFSRTRQNVNTWSWEEQGDEPDENGLTSSDEILLISSDEIVLKSSDQV